MAVAADAAAATGLVLAVPCARVSADPATFRACMSLLRAQHASLAGAAADGALARRAVTSAALAARRQP